MAFCFLQTEIDSLLRVSIPCAQPSQSDSYWMLVYTVHASEETEGIAV